MTFWKEFTNRSRVQRKRETAGIMGRASGIRIRKRLFHTALDPKAYSPSIKM
jgi:hypothetical protein